MSKTGAIQEHWLEQWAERVHCSGLSVVFLPLLEISRGLGFLVSQALLLAQPVLTGLVDEASMARYITLLDDPAELEKLIERIERKAQNSD